MSRYCRCGTALAADNTTRLCGACQTTREDGAPDVPAEFWQTDVMAAALDSGDLGRVLRAYRCHPYHRQRVSQMVVAGWLHMSQAAVCRIEQGRRRVTIDEIANVTRVLGMPVALPWVAQPEVGEDVDPLSRRSLFGAGVGAAFGLSATTAPAAAREVDPELASHWMTLLRVLGRHDAMVGARDVLDTAGHELGLITRHRQVARGELHIQLIGVEARWAWFASWLSHDSGDWHRRDAWIDRALQLAQAADDHEMVAWVLLWQSRWAAMRHDAPRAIALADAARHTPGTTDKTRALCAFKQAHAHALAANATSCQRSLADAYRLLDHAAPSDRPMPNKRIRTAGRRKPALCPGRRSPLLARAAAVKGDSDARRGPGPLALRPHARPRNPVRPPRARLRRGRRTGPCRGRGHDGAGHRARDAVGHHLARADATRSTAHRLECPGRRGLPRGTRRDLTPGSAVVATRRAAPRCATRRRRRTAAPTHRPPPT